MVGKGEFCRFSIACFVDAQTSMICPSSYSACCTGSMGSAQVSRVARVARVARVRTDHTGHDCHHPQAKPTQQAQACVWPSTNPLSPPWSPLNQGLTFEFQRWCAFDLTMF